VVGARELERVKFIVTDVDMLLWDIAN